MRRTLWSSLGLLLSLALLAGPIACRSTQSPGTQVDDSAITTQLNAKLAADPDVKATDVAVQTDEGIVTLTGRVATDESRREAEKLARDTEGVKGVRNFIRVGQEPKLGIPPTQP